MRLTYDGYLKYINRIRVGKFSNKPPAIFGVNFPKLTFYYQESLHWQHQLCLVKCWLYDVFCLLTFSTNRNILKLKKICIYREKLFIDKIVFVSFQLWHFPKKSIYNLNMRLFKEFLSLTHWLKYVHIEVWNSFLKSVIIFWSLLWKFPLQSKAIKPTRPVTLTCFFKKSSRHVLQITCFIS